MVDDLVDALVAVWTENGLPFVARDAVVTEKEYLAARARKVADSAAQVQIAI